MKTQQISKEIKEPPCPGSVFYGVSLRIHKVASAQANSTLWSRANVCIVPFTGREKASL